MGDTLEELDTRLEVQDILESLVTHPELMDTPLEAMDTQQVDTLQGEQQGTLQEVLTLLGATDTPLEVMDIHQEDTLQEGQRVTLLEAMDTPREDMDTLLEVMDTLQVAILQDILLEGIGIYWRWILRRILRKEIRRI